MWTAVVGGSIHRAATKISEASDERSSAWMRSHRMKDLIKDWGTRDRSGGLVGGFGVAVTFQNNPRKIQCVTIASMSTLPPGFAIRTATLDDVKTIVGHRRAMFFDIRSPDEATLDSMAGRFWAGVMREMAAGGNPALVLV